MTTGSRRPADRARRTAYDALRMVTGQDAYANLALSDLLGERRLSARDAAFATELLSGTCRLMGTYDLIIQAAAGRRLATLQPAVIDLLRLGCHQLLSMRVPVHAAVGATVDLAAATVGRRVTGLVNAVLRAVSARDMDGWLAVITAGMDPAEARVVRSHHPAWIVDAYTDLLGADEADEALAANNEPPVTHIVARPGLCTLAELTDAGAGPGRWSPFAATFSGPVGALAAVREGRAGVQDEGSQLVAVALDAVDAPDGPWLDLCAGPGGKAALLSGLAMARGQRVLASERQPHRAHLVAEALRRYPDPWVIVADATRPAWPASAFARVLADVPCTGLGALRRRPESRWRRTPDDLASLAGLQRRLLGSALDSAMAGGVVAYVTCSPHRQETTAVVHDAVTGRDDVDVLDAPSVFGVPDCALGPYVQLWPHRHGTDAMFCALLRRR